MSRDRESGIPALRVRTDSSEEAREWNKHRDAIYSIYDAAPDYVRPIPTPRVEGFRPIARVDSDSGSSTVPGVGITVGRLFFIESNTITTASGDRNKAQEVMPTLEGTALDATIAPRKYLSASDYEAWVIWRELGDTHEAKILFAGEGAGPGALDRDEKAQRLATFTVTYPGGTDASGQQPGVTIKKQLIRDRLQVPIERHQFKVRKTAADKVKVDKGFLVYLKGLSDPLVSASLEATESAEITISGNGSIWLSASWSVYQHSESSIGSGIHLRMYRLDSLGSPSFSFRTSAPTRGTNSSDQFTSGTLWFEIAEVELVGGEVFVTDQIINGPIYVNELADGKISAT